MRRGSVVICVLLFLFVATIAVAEKVNRVKVGLYAEGNVRYIDALKEYFSKYYTLVPLEEKVVKLFLKLKKEGQLGIRESLKSGKLLNVDFLVKVDEKGVSFYDIPRGGTEKSHRIPEGNMAVDDVIKYFENYVLYFKLPTFEDKKAYKGKIYVVLDENLDPVGYYEHPTPGKKVTIPKEKIPNGVYARYLRPAVIIRKGDKIEVIYERKEMDLSLTVYTDKFRVFKEGEIVYIPVRVENGGYMSVIDICGDEIMLLDSEPVEVGIWGFEFEAYKGEEEQVETLVFMLTDEKPKSPSNFKELKEILEHAKGVDIIRFVVK